MAQRNCEIGAMAQQWRKSPCCCTPRACSASRVSRPSRFATCQRFAHGYACQAARSHRQQQPDQPTSHLPASTPAGSRKRVSGRGRIDVILAPAQNNLDIQRRCDRGTCARTIAGDSARPVDSFTGLARTVTAAKHQRPRQRAYRPWPWTTSAGHIAHTRPTRLRPSHTTPAFVGLCQPRPCDCRSQIRPYRGQPAISEGTSRARSLSNLGILIGKTREPAPARGWQRRKIPKSLILFEGRGRRGKIHNLSGLIICPSSTVPAAPKFWAAPSCKTSLNIVEHCRS